MRIDTHCHLDGLNHAEIDEIVSSMKDNLIIVSGVDYDTNQHVIELCKKYTNIYGTIGIHPEYALQDKSTIDKTIKQIDDNIGDEKIVGIGEIGLDYHYSKDNIMQQQSLFRAQLDIATKYNKTVVIHSRDSINDTYNILKEYKSIKKVIHCYSSSLDMAYLFRNINCKFGIGGVLTFKNSEKLKDIVKSMDISNFLLETDSPYLAPEPLRGTKNVPYNTLYVAKKIAELKNVPIEEVERNTTLNAIYQFDLPFIM